tara:strand:- start:196 stop:930 length:735 start_codon:yes stop_codon:yes gene_type:complete
MRIPPPAVEGTGYVPDFLEKDEHEYLLDIYNNMEWGKVHSFKLFSSRLDIDVVKKYTGIEERLKKHFKNFEIVAVNMYQANKQHNLHVDIGSTEPDKCGYDFVIPLLIEGNGTQEELLEDQVMITFNQYYPYGPFKFPPGSWDEKTKTVRPELTKTFSNTSKTHEEVKTQVWNWTEGVWPEEVYPKYMDMYPREMLEGFTVENIYPWRIGSCIALQRTQIHSASRFRKKVTKKVGLQVLCYHVL